MNYQWIKSKNIKILMNALKNKNHDFRFVGGAVRKTILKEKDISDYDIASNFTPKEIIHLLEKNNIKYLTIGINYGTITAIINKESFEITTLRKDIKTYGRKAEVQFTKDFYLDAKRRDFTFNAIYLNPITLEITDYFNGVNHLKQGIVNFIGDPTKRIQEDFLRILRFFRFYNLYGKSEIDSNLMDILKKNSKYLINLSKERIYAEIVKILASKNPIIILEIIKNKILPNIFALDKNNLNSFHNLLEIEKILKYYNLNVRFALLISDTNKINNIILTKKDNKEIRNILFMQEFILKNQVVEFTEICRIASFYNIEIIIKALIITSCFNENYKHHYLDIIKKLLQKTQEDFPITGNDIKQLGIKEGKNISDILSYLKFLFLQYYNNDKDFYIKKAIQYINEKNLK